MPPPLPDRITYLAEPTFRSRRTRFGIRAPNRLLHLYAIGQASTPFAPYIATVMPNS